MLARRLPTIMPGLGFEEKLELTRIYSIAGLLSREHPLIDERPFRSPHHTSTPQAIAGGGRNPRPGEITLAHKGVLFLDEMPEFSRASLELLRQPMEDKVIQIARARLYVMCCNEPLSLWLLSGFKQMYLYCRRDHTLYGKNQSPSSGQN